MKHNFCAMILTHGRPGRITTLRSLDECGYTGPVLIVIDNEDETADQYRALYGERVVMFDKDRYAREMDEADNFDNRNAVVYARNAAFDIAESLGYRYFMQLDDDYVFFSYRFDAEFRMAHMWIRSLDDVFDAMIDYYESIPALTIAMAQGGDYLGGHRSDFTNAIRTKRKAMNTFLCSTERRFRFLGRINEDVTTYVLEGSRGRLFLTTNMLRAEQRETQTSAGGMTVWYHASGTYVKSFYTVMHAPSSTKIDLLGPKHPRLHHRINWNTAVPKIVREKHRRQPPADVD